MNTPPQGRSGVLEMEVQQSDCGETKGRACAFPERLQHREHVCMCVYDGRKLERGRAESLWLLHEEKHALRKPKRTLYFMGLE